MDPNFHTQLKGQFVKINRAWNRSASFRLTATENNTPPDKVIYCCCCINEPVIFSHCVHPKLGHQFHALLKVWSDRDDIVPLITFLYSASAVCNVCFWIIHLYVRHCAQLHTCHNRDSYHSRPRRQGSKCAGQNRGRRSALIIGETEIGIEVTSADGTSKQVRYLIWIMIWFDPWIMTLLCLDCQYLLDTLDLVEMYPDIFGQIRGGN